MTEPTTATKTATSVAERAAVGRSAKAAADASNVLPTVVETAELAMEVPSKVVLNQKLVVIVSVVGGAALGAGILFGVNKLRERMANKKAEKENEIIEA